MDSDLIVAAHFSQSTIFAISRPFFVIFAIGLTGSQPSISAGSPLILETAMDSRAKDARHAQKEKDGLGIPRMNHGD